MHFTGSSKDANQIMLRKINRHTFLESVFTCDLGVKY